MDDLSTASSTSDRAQALAAIEAAHPRWHTWIGVAGLLYASIPRSSPPIVVHADTPRNLENEIILAEARRRRS